MAYEYDRFEREEGGGSFLMGLLAGTVLGAGLGMLFAPKAGSELRSQLGTQFADQTGKLRDAADPLYQQASEKVSQIVDRGRDAYDRARSSVTSMASTGTSGTSPTPGSTSSTGSTGSTGNKVGTTSTQGGSYGA
jgi:gas vesicle protein